MAEIRSVKTKIWRDSWYRGLEPMAKLLYVYLFSNEYTSLCGFYELPLPTISLDTGIKDKILPGIFSQLKGRVEYIDGWVCIKNYAHHQNYASSPKVVALINRDLLQIPQKVKDQANNRFSLVLGDGYPMDTVAIPSDKEEDKDIDYERGGVGEMTPKEKTEEFFGGVADLLAKKDVPWLKDFLRAIAETNKVEKAAIWGEIQKFYFYWTEKNGTGTKQRWQTERTFEVDRRLATWFRRAGFGSFSASASRSRGKNIIGLE